jgi:anti-sigma B factor antagonist
MMVSFEEVGGALVVKTDAARIDAIFAKSFRDQVMERATGQRLVVLDLQQVTYMDSSGVGCLVSIIKCLAPGGSLRLVRVNDTVRSLLKLTHMEKVFPVFASLQSAVGMS